MKLCTLLFLFSCNISLRLIAWLQTTFQRSWYALDTKTVRIMLHKVSWGILYFMKDCPATFWIHIEQIYSETISYLCYWNKIFSVTYGPFLFNPKSTKQWESRMLHEDQLISPLDELLFAATTDKESLEPIHQVDW